MTDIVDRLTEATGFALMDAARQTLRDAVAEIRRLRGELVLWKAAAKLTLDEQKTIVDAILVAVAGGHTNTARRLNWLRERMMFPVTETMPKEKRAEVSYRKTDEKRGDGHTSRATLTDAEREAIAWAARLAQSQRDSRDMAGDYAASMRGLLERMAAANSGEDRRSGGGE